jgi:hypothetical protein
MVMAKKELADNAHHSQSAEEAYQSYLEYFKMAGDLLRKYEVDPTSSWFISPFSGSVAFWDANQLS